jgi:ABC-type metal ion transport system substrate-binding protein
VIEIHGLGKAYPTQNAVFEALRGVDLEIAKGEIFGITNYAPAAGLNPTRDALFIEGADSPYANLVAARPDNVNSPAIQKLVAALRSPAAKQFVKETYHGAVLTTF